MITETKTIGIDTGLGIGTFHNTEYVDGSIRLKVVDTDNNHNPVYAMEGYWESEIIDLVDKFKDYDTVALSKTQESKDVISIETRVSDDGINFTDYQSVSEENKIQSETKRYIQIKINFFAGMNKKEYTLFNFDSPDEIDNWNNSEFVDMTNGLRLKRNYELEMSRELWNDEGSLHSFKVSRNDWKKVDSLNILIEQ